MGTAVLDAEMRALFTTLRTRTRILARLEQLYLLHIRIRAV